jgi:hypothetical protein
MWPTYFIPGVQGQYYLTTRPYPIEVIESMVSAGNLWRGARWNTGPEDMYSTATFLGGEWRDTLRTYSMEPEAMYSTATFLGGTWRDILRTYSMEPEAMYSTATFLGGVWDEILITYSNYPPESMYSTATFLGGTRT